MNRALAIKVASHPDVAKDLNNLAQLLEREVEADPVYGKQIRGGTQPTYTSSCSTSDLSCV
ncbi:MAG: hypothetical protein O3B01_25995 [Planctomycetota bacterium]|nr:hypothetical protein [Planctomycetota bacterium]